MKTLSRLIGIVTIWALSSAVAQADQTDLALFGNFDTLTVEQIGGFETYEITCNEVAGTCQDNIGNSWQFGATLVDHMLEMCDTNFDLGSYLCVRTMELNLELAEPYSNAVLEIQRRRCGDQNLYVNGNFIGSIKGTSTVEYAIGILTPGKSHSIVITTPETDETVCSGGDRRILVHGLAIRGEPISNRNN